MLPTSSTAPAFPPSPLDEDRRSGRRHATVLLIGKVRHDGRIAACLVHDISANGLMARFTSPRRVGEGLLIEVRGLPEVRATVRWVDGYKAGVEFGTAQEIARVFCLRDEEGLVMRTPRFAMQASASFRLGARRWPVDIHDISPGGAKLSGAVAVQVGQAGSVVLPEIDAAVFGVICWVRDDRFGLRFCTPLPLTSLSRVLGCG